MSELRKMKELKYLSIKEFREYTELLKEEPIDKIAILKLFNLDSDKMDVYDVEEAFNKLALMYIPEFKAMKTYDITDKKGKSRRFALHDNIHTITGSQFIDFQSYTGTGNLAAILSVFMLPMEKTWYGKWKTKKYGKNYSVFEVQKYLDENMMIGDANGIAGFFLSGCLTSLQVIQTYSEKALKQEKEKQMKKLKDISKRQEEKANSNGFKLLRIFRKS